MSLSAIVFRRIAAVVLIALAMQVGITISESVFDEEYFIKRSIWLRNVALGIPLHGADLIYATRVQKERFAEGELSALCLRPCWDTGQALQGRRRHK